MTYELAKKLKEAGFSQVWPSGKGELFIGEEINSGLKEGVYIPSLSELIEACGEEFDELKKGYGEGWDAYAGGTDYDNFPNFRGTGSTPEEAVANLWLELNKK